MNARVPANLSGGNIVLGGVHGQAKDVIGVSRIELLLVRVLVVDDAQGSNMVHQRPLACVVQVATTVVTTVTAREKGKARMAGIHGFSQTPIFDAATKISH